MTFGSGPADPDVDMSVRIDRSATVQHGVEAGPEPVMGAGASARGMSVGVAMVNYQYGRFIGGALDSIFSQTSPVDEVIVVDDGSTDESRDVLKSYEDRATIILTENRGQTAGLNLALARCKSDIVCLLDSDDLMQPNRVARITEIYRNHPEVDWVFHTLAHVRRADLQPTEQPPPSKGFVEGLHDLRSEVQRGRLPVSMPATSGLSFRNSFLQRQLPLVAEIRLPDNYLKFVSMAKAPGFIIEEPLGMLGIHDTNLYSTKTGAAQRRFRADTTIPICKGFDLAGPELRALSDRLLGEALVLSRLGSTLSGARRRDMMHLLQARSALRLTGIGLGMCRGAAREAVQAIAGKR
jgi:hypothetical protein